MFEAIEAKRNELRQQGIDVGAPQGVARDAGFGGAVQDFAAGSIYWHPNTGAHFLNGPIRGTYLALHGPGLDPECLLRPLGFPTTDNTREANRQVQFANFEWGSIYSVAGRFGFAIHQGIAASLPKLAMPGFVGLTGLQIKLPPVSGLLLSAGERPTAAISAIESLWTKRIGLQRVDKPTEIVNLEVHVTVGSGGLIPSRPKLEQHATLPAGVSLKERKLYNMILRSPRGELLNVAPHAFYSRSNWDQFGVIHVTDTHLAARLDFLQQKMAETGSSEGIANFINFNDSFRHLVRYANKLHRKGQLDLILLTGDVVDYQYETSDERADQGGGGNFAVFERLVLGQEPSPTGVPAEELCVPISATLGNHDYRENHYTLIFEVGIPKVRHEVSAYAPMNLTKAEALHGQGSGSVPTHSRDTAKDEVHVETPTYALRKLCAGPGATEASFILRLGPHRVVMLDSKHDIGIVDSILEWLGAQLYGSEDQKTFLGGSPNVAGVAEHHLELVRVALREAGENGAVIVGIHGPCVNPAGNDFAHFLRETEHASAPEADMMGWLGRRGALPPSSGPGSLQPRPTAWFDAFGKPYFNRGANEQLLDSDGVSKGELDDFLRHAAGAPGPGGERLRPVDLILSGHGHFRTELRVGWDEEIQGGLYFMDFYTENPVRYYATRKDSVDGGKERIHIYVSKRAGRNGKPVQRTDEFPAYLTLDVPPYATPLNDATDKRQWWKDHRPVFLETGALGPIESRSNTRRESAPVSQRPDISFSGFRYLTVAGSSIESIRYTRLPELRQQALTTPWEPSTVITYDKTKGIGEVHLAEANGRLRRLGRHTNWRKSWALIVRGDFGGRGVMDALFYDPESNTGEFWEFSTSGGMRLLGQHTNWRSTWTHIVPLHVRMGGTSGLLFHEQQSRASEVYGTGEGGAMELLFKPGSGVNKASHIVPIDVTGGLFSKVLSYDGETGHAIMGIAVGNVIFQDWKPNWTHIVPGHFGGDGFTDLLFYQASTGTGEFNSINDRGEINLIRSHSGWRRSWTHIIAGNFGGGGKQSDLLFYEASTKTAEIWAVDRTGGIRRLNVLSNFGPWTHIVA